MIAPGKTIGVLGGGQLGRMLAQAAQTLGYRVHVYEPQIHCPAGAVANHEVNASYQDADALLDFARGVDVVTYEFENIPAAALAVHHADCEWPFRQNSDFWYLTGFDEPEAVALFLPHRPEGERFVLFVQPREASAEVWNGFRWGCEGAVAAFGADLAHPHGELPQRLADYLKGAEGIAFRVGRHPEVEPLVLQAWAAQLDRAPRNGAAAPQCHR